MLPQEHSRPAHGPHCQDGDVLSALFHVVSTSPPGADGWVLEEAGATGEF